MDMISDSKPIADAIYTVIKNIRRRYNYLQIHGRNDTVSDPPFFDETN